MARRSFYYSPFFPNSPLLKINSIKKQLTPPIHSSTWPKRFQVPSSMSSREIVIKACHWPVLKTRRTRVIKQTHQKGEFYTENSSKEAQKLQGVRIATLAIRVLYFHPRATKQDPMIRRNRGLRSKGASKA
ncbi:hypothetical protein Tco_1173108 [Tanacetum coccineum]